MTPTNHRPPPVNLYELPPSNVLRRLQYSLSPSHLSLNPSPDIGPCVRWACAKVSALRAAGVAARDSWVACGYIADDSRCLHDHAWVLSRHGAAWHVSDQIDIPDADRDPIVFLNGSLALSADPPAVLSSLRPAFFLTVHNSINTVALQSLFDEDEIDDINAIQFRVDDPWKDGNYDPREHFDNSMILESIALIDDRLRWQNGTPLGTAAPAARRSVAFGLAAHAVADYYAHSNYVPMIQAFSRAQGVDDSDAGQLPTIDAALVNPNFLKFVEANWKNIEMWQDEPGLAIAVKPKIAPGFQCCNLTGGYGGDSWIARSGIPHHNDFAVDYGTGPGYVNEPKMTLRDHPFAFPDRWPIQYALRTNLAIRHVRGAVTRALAGSTAPFLGPGVALPPSLQPPPWELPSGMLAANVALPVRDPNGWRV